MKRPLQVAVLVVISATSLSGIQQSSVAPYCAVESPGTRVLASRPSASEAAVDDVNWFARPVPNAGGDWIVAFASHNENFLYNLTRATRVRIPDRSDAVATPDGKFMTVPSNYTATNTVNFYDNATLLERLAAGQSAADVPPLFAHKHPDVAAVYYQSVGVVGSRQEGANTVTTYRMMFSGSRVEPRPGFRVVDYVVRSGADGTTFTPSEAMKLCPEIVDDMSTPFISKDGRYVVAHDRPVAGGPGTLKIFEIMSVDPASRTTTCAMRVDLGFAAGKADFSFDNKSLTFHISKHDYLTPFINGGLRAPAITDVVVVDLLTDAAGRITGHGPLARVTTTTVEGTGSYFPAFFPDGKLFYIASHAPRDSAGPKRFDLRVVDPVEDRRMARLFQNETLASNAAAIGTLWQSACASGMQPFKGQEAVWPYVSLTQAQCTSLVAAHADDASKAGLTTACAAK